MLQDLSILHQVEVKQLTIYLHPHLYFTTKCTSFFYLNIKNKKHKKKKIIISIYNNIKNW